MSKQPSHREDFEVAILCSIPLEYDAAALQFDEFWDEHGDPFGRSAGDLNTYTLGRIGTHNVVLALGLDMSGTELATAVASMRHSYTALKLVILTGICHGVPFTGQAELLLGDVIISNAFVRYGDIAVKYENESQSQVYMSSNHVDIRNLFASLHTERGLYLLQQRTAYFLRKFQKGVISRQKRKYQYPGAAEDKLFDSAYRHKHRKSVTCICGTLEDLACEEALGTSCNDLGCNEEYLMERARLKEQNMRNDQHMPALHIGKVASIDVMLLKKREDWDVIAKTESVIAFGYSGAWALQDMPVILVKGVSNYADGHNNKKWRDYAAATAASAIRAILEVYPLPDNDQHVENLSMGQFLVPIDRNPIFTGREIILSRLLTKISPDARKDGYYRAAITGHKGVGKTQVALEAVYRLHDKYTDCSIFWVSAKDPETFEKCYYQIGKQIKIKEIDNEGADIKQLIKTALSEESSSSWLLVIDDADTLKLSELSDYLPFSRNGLILFIVQGAEEAERMDIPKPNIFPIEGLDIGEALSLAQKGLKENRKSYTYSMDTKRLFDFLRKPISMYEAPSDWMKAEKREVGLMKVLMECLGDEHPETLSSMHNLAYIYGELGRWSEAEQLALQVLHLRRKVLGEEHPDTLASEHSLASIYANQGRWEEAEDLYTSVIKARKRIIGSRHPDTLASMYNLASVYRGLGRLSEAVMLEGEVQEGYNMESETDPSQMLASTHVPASKYMNQGRQEEAEMLEVQTLEISNTKLTLLDQRPPLTGEPKDMEGDSGYGSLRAPTIPSMPDLQNNVDATNTIVSSEKGEVEIDMLVQLDDDIRSVVSEGDDIRSQISDVTTNEGMTGKALIRAFLAEQPQFKSLCEKALAKMNRQRFIENMSRLLRSFHKGLAEEAKSEAEKVVARLLRSKRGRRRISEQLAAHVDMEHEETQDKIDLEIPSSKMQNVENWLSQAMKPSLIEDVEQAVDLDQDIEQDSDAMEMDSEDGNEPYSFPYISELKAFLLASKAFQSLQVQFALMFLSFDLGYTLQSIPKENIWLSQEQDVSILNLFKSLVENTTRVRWNWWPLSQRKRVLNPGESRLFWQCTCGSEQWEEISSDQREIVENILEWLDNRPPLASRCLVKKSRTTLLSSIKGILNYTNGGQITRPSQAATRYTPQTSSSSAPPQSVQLQPLAGAASPHQQQGSTIGQQAQVVTPGSTNNQQWWILLGIKGARRTLVPTQIHVTSQTTDSDIFQELKKSYKIHRGRLRLWFSVWRLDYCEVVKFSRLTPDRMVREYKDLPLDKDYHYDPRAGGQDVKNPPISPHHFQTRFYACSSPCTWLLPHDCMPLPQGPALLPENTIHLGRIPKRIREFGRDPSSPIWGFETVFAVSPEYVLAYHLVIVAGPLIFWGLWLKAHPDDLQNATVPITVVLGALSLFWSAAGILTSRERE
ncbi:hypothetical protein V8C43DRAFT_302439 [Trichoderma afarasin]